MLADLIRERYELVLSRIHEAVTRSGQRRETQVVVVSKGQPLEVIQAAVSAGIRVFGENYAEEALGKMDLLGESSLEWHMVGHVQSRKAGLVADHFDILHSLDSLKLGNRLESFCARTGRILPVLVEINVSGEDSKYGFPAWEEAEWEKLLSIFESLAECTHLEIRGLMTMPPFFEDPQFTRPYFSRLHRLQDYLAFHLPNIKWEELSMGTSIDFEAAVEEGATMVRIGQAILGPRHKTTEVK